MNVRTSTNGSIQSDCEDRVNNEQTKVLPYAGGTHSVTCAPNNGCIIIHRKKTSASDNEINCRKTIAKPFGRSTGTKGSESPPKCFRYVFHRWFPTLKRPLR